nr:1369_t:CDS:2 [Entrophospora candida]
MGMRERNHTGHIGITELRSGKVDPEKIKKQMAEVAATLNIDFANTVSIDDDNNISTTTTTLSSNQNSEITDQSAKEFKIKRKSTLSTTTSIPVLSSQSSQSTNELIVDPMKKVFAALRMPSDGNFDQIYLNEFAEAQMQYLLLLQLVLTLTDRSIYNFGYLAVHILHTQESV